MHIPNKASGGQAGRVARRPSFFTGRPVLQFGADMAAALGVLIMVSMAALPLPSPATRHTTLCSPPLTSLLLLLRRGLLLG